jgi:uncharacterized protein YdiU (UPF0061 family)
MLMSTVLAPRFVDLSELSFQSAFAEALPADVSDVNVPRQVRNASYTKVRPTPVRSPRLLSWSDALAEDLGITRPKPGSPALEVLAGNRVLPGMQPFAARYGGHQFGVWAGQLGDGRAITLGDIAARNGGRQELQLKGAGRTPYSRTADGRAVLRSSLREYLCSEALHWLGVPTTRALSLVGTGEDVIRDMFYDGHPAPEPGAVVCRVAPSFLRFGNFQIHTAHDETDILRTLFDFVSSNYYSNRKDWFGELCRRTALLMADWMRLGFVHGVMNTDNMSILGLTIDFGPYGWLEGYDPMWTPNTTDAEGRRYCYGNQPHIGLWNLARLAEALLPLVEKEELEAGLKLYGEVYQEAMTRALAQKLGLSSLDRDGDSMLVTDLFRLLASVETDYTLFFRNLAKVEKIADTDLLNDAYYGEISKELQPWLERYLARVHADNLPAATRAQRMNAVNPKYVPRNYLAQQAIDAMTQGDASVLEKLMSVLQRPYDEQPANETFAARRPEWARHKAGCSALSCSS